ncbi:Tubby-like protein 8 [Olea europaea subsp. europaea]|uniref:Tubby-like protein 8 n=1 Tax=Olea europaea subsp. europaea TaxID=158383 RepID=A0A8S0PGD9_OLEEU|nr:Tubby-like protein 8 [Olea europaea subsp. europaea]
MSSCKKISVPRNPSYNSLYHNPLIDKKQKHNRSSSEGGNMRRCLASIINEDKENALPNAMMGKMYGDGKENVVPNIEHKTLANGKSQMKDSTLKSSSLQSCIQKNVSDSIIGLKYWEPVDSESSNSVNMWDYSDSEAAPAAPWSTLPNRSLLYRPLPVDVGRCTCVIVKDSSPEGLDGCTLYTLYTNEGHGRQNRKLAVARHKRLKGRSEFRIAQNEKGIMNSSDDSLIGFVTANILGSKYHVWDQGNRRNSLTKHSKLLAAVKFNPTVSTWTGNCRCMNAWIPKYQSMQLKNTTQIQHINGLPIEWEGKKDKVHQLVSRVPQYNKISKQYELDFRDRGRAGLKIQSSVKNFQLTLERNGRQTILQLGRVGKSKYVMDYRYPLTGYQAFCICLASIDSKLCCTV